MPATPVVRIVQSIADVPAADWDACANPCASAQSLSVDAVEDPSQRERFNPFITHAFLHALEVSKSVGGRSGWLPTHIVDGRYCACVVNPWPSQQEVESRRDIQHLKKNIKH